MKRGAIYCRVAYRGEPDAQALDAQERLCRKYATDRNIQIDIRHVYVDAFRQAWEPGAAKPGWQALLEAMRQERLTDVIVCRLDRFLRRPAELLALAQQADTAGIRLHGCPPAAISDLVRQAERRVPTLDALSSHVRSAQQRASLAGLPHGGGRRAYGYQAGMKGLDPGEASIVGEIYQSYGEGTSLTRIAKNLNDRGVPTVTGVRWSAASIARILDAPRYAGLRRLSNHDSRLTAGAWPPCVERRLWQQVQDLRRAAAAPTSRRREYLLTGMLTCTACGHHMVGSVVGDYRMYICSKSSRWTGAVCGRSIAAGPLEALVQEHAIVLLESWNRRELGSVPVAVASDGTLKVRPHRAMDGVTVGRSARKDWKTLTYKRRQDVLRFLYPTIYIGQSTTIRSVFDETRVHLVGN